VYYKPHSPARVGEFSGSKKRSGGAHRVHARPFEGPIAEAGIFILPPQTPAADFLL
jgi:hypothetical protein